MVENGHTFFLKRGGFFEKRFSSQLGSSLPLFSDRLPVWYVSKPTSQIRTVSSTAKFEAIQKTCLSLIWKHVRVRPKVPTCAEHMLEVQDEKQTALPNNVSGDTKWNEALCLHVSPLCILCSFCWKVFRKGLNATVARSFPKSWWRICFTLCWSSCRWGRGPCI